MSKQILHIKNGTTQGYIDLTLPGCADLAYPNSKNRRGRVQSDGRVCPTITAATTGIHYFKITERERKIIVCQNRFHCLTQLMQKLTIVQ